MGPEPWEDWEGAAAELLDATCSSSPVDMRQLATACRVDVRPWRCRDGAQVRFATRTVYVDQAARHERQQGLIAHELGHVALDRSALDQSERAASYVAGAIRLPWRETLAQLRDTAWSIAAMRKLQPHASATVIGVRTTQLRNAVLSIFDPVGRIRPWRLARPDTPAEIARRPTAVEHRLSAEAWAEQREVRRGELCVATPLFDHSRAVHRVLVVCCVDELQTASRHLRRRVGGRAR